MYAGKDLFAGLSEVWYSSGAGLKTGPRFRLLVDARRYVESRRGETSFAIRTPEGRWHLFRKESPADADTDGA